MGVQRDVNRPCRGVRASLVGRAVAHTPCGAWLLALGSWLLAGEQMISKSSSCRQRTLRESLGALLEGSEAADACTIHMDICNDVSAIDQTGVAACDARRAGGRAAPRRRRSCACGPWKKASLLLGREELLADRLESCSCSLTVSV